MKIADQTAGADGCASVNLKHLRRLTDETGLLQHATYSVPRRSEGYSADDNARGLLLMSRLAAAGGEDVVVDLATVYLSFLQYAQTERGHFHNFMSYDRQWLDTPSSEDCQGRCLWALAELLSSPLPDHVRHSAEEMLTRGIGQFDTIYSPRATSSFLLAAEALAATGRLERMDTLAHEAADRLLGKFRGVADDTWVWFEHYLTYANARLPHAMFAAYHLFRQEEYLDAARRSLDFLIRETVHDGCLVPVGNNGWYPRGGTKAEFDQQPIEVVAMVEAALAAHRATGQAHYADVAALSGRWFTGGNCLGVAMADSQRGSCRDGLAPGGANQNEGAESTLAFLISQQALDKAGLSW